MLRVSPIQLASPVFHDENMRKVSIVLVLAGVLTGRSFDTHSKACTFLVRCGETCELKGHSLVSSRMLLLTQNSGIGVWSAPCTDIEQAVNEPANAKKVFCLV